MLAVEGSLLHVKVYHVAEVFVLKTAFDFERVVVVVLHHDLSDFLAVLRLVKLVTDGSKEERRELA